MVHLENRGEQTVADSVTATRALLRLPSYRRGARDEAEPAATQTNKASVPWS